MNSRKATARLAGLLYLLVAVTSGFAAIVRSGRVMPGDVASTVNAIMASQRVFRFAIVSDLAGQVLHVFLVLALFRLFKSVDQNQAGLMAALGLVPVPIAMLNQLNQLAALRLASTADTSQVLFFLSQHADGVFIAQIFWGLWLFPLGVLVFRSGFVPRVLGLGLVIAGLGYLVDSFGKLMWPSSDVAVSVVTFMGEVLFLLWLLIKGSSAPLGE